MKETKTAKDKNGEIIRVGDRVRAISIYDGKLMNEGMVVKINRQGYDGTILRLDTNPDPDYKYHFSHRASETIKL